MRLPVFAGPLVAALAALLLACLFFEHVRLPDLFPWSSVLVPALLTGMLALGYGLLLPDWLHFTHSERLSMQLQQATGLTGYDPERVLSRVETARQHAKTLRASLKDMQPEIAEATAAAADDLDALSGRLLESPQHANSAMTLISRADLVVEAVTRFTDFKKDAGAKTADINLARQQVKDSLIQMSKAANDEQSRLARIKLTEIDIATDVADGLFGKGEQQ